jgi:UPF0176 protein
MPTYQVLLYYKFVRIADPADLAAGQQELCAKLGLRGRILTAAEGINGTVSGPREACQAYISAMHADPRFADMPFKVDDVDDHVFPSLSVKVKSELVTFRVDANVDPIERTAPHLSPEVFRRMMDDPDVVILDGRTDYEYDIGHFRGAVRPDVSSFREFPQWIRTHLADAKDRPILTYCTGGIRCEKLTAFMLAEGFANVYQLDGGIVTYGKDPTVQGAMWDGLCYVFDERITVPINHTDDRRVVGSCHHCGAPTERYVNCANLDCHFQHLSCDTCAQAYERSCSEACMHAPRREA